MQGLSPGFVKFVKSYLDHHTGMKGSNAEWLISHMAVCRLKQWTLPIPFLSDFRNVREIYGNNQ